MIENNTKSIYDKLGPFNLLFVVARVTPWYALLTLPYGYWVYSRLTKENSTLDGLLSGHSDMYASSKFYRWVRPRYYDMKEILIDPPYNIKESSFKKSSSRS